MSTSIHRAVWDWLKQCPSVKKLSFNFATESTDLVLLRPTRSVEEAYTGGAVSMAYTVELTIFKPLTFDADDNGNIDMLESVDDISDWISEQVQMDNLPVLPEGHTFSDFTLMENQTEFAIAQDGMFAKYIIPFTIYYLKE